MFSKRSSVNNVKLFTWYELAKEGGQRASGNTSCWQMESIVLTPRATYALI